MNVSPRTLAADLQAEPRLSLRFSVIVAVYNRSQDLERLLSALGRQTFPRDRFEVLICDDGSTEDLFPSLERAASDHGLSIIDLRQQRQGPGAARNLGLAHAHAEIAVFTDSDCIPRSSWLTALDNAFETRGLDLAGGAIDFRDAEHLSGRCINFLLSSSLGGAGVMDPRCALHANYRPVGGNLAVRRNLAVEAGGFPEGTSYLEDIVFSHRVGRLEARVGFAADATVVHNERKGLLGVFLKSFRMGQARAWLGRHHRINQFFHVIPAMLITSLAGSALLTSLQPRTLPFALIPWAGYAIVLVFLAIQGATALREVGAIVAVPWFALLLHVGYGLGYLAAASGLIAGPGLDRPVPWGRLRASPDRSDPREAENATLC